MINHLLDVPGIAVLVDGLPEARQDLPHIERVKDNKREVLDVFLHLLIAVVAGL